MGASGIYKYTVSFEGYGDNHIKIAELLEKLLRMMNYTSIDFSWKLIADEGGTDEILQTDSCGRCGNDMTGQVFGDYKHICTSCRAKEHDMSGSNEYTQYMNDLEKQGKKYDDVLGEVDIK